MAGFTVAHLEAIESAIAVGELTVDFDGKRVTYQSIEDLLKRRDLIKGELEAAGLIAVTPRRSYAAHSKD